MDLFPINYFTNIGGRVTSKNFNKCAKNGGKVKVKELKGNRYIKICYDEKGNSYASKVMKKKKNDPRALIDSLFKLKERYDSARI